VTREYRQLKEGHVFGSLAPRSLALDALALVVIAGLGLACVLLPVLTQASLMPAPLFPLLRTSIEQMTWAPIALLAALGLLAGLLTRLWPLFIALASVATLPIATIAELIADPTSHNLFPFEWMMYLLMAVPVLLTALVGSNIRAQFAHRRGLTPAPFCPSRIDVFPE
jgi:hypothetical protein